jgi:uncharacterized protein YuzE
MDDLIIDFNSKKEVSAIELLSASVFFKNLGRMRFPSQENPC